MTGEQSMKNFAPVWYTIPAFENTVPVSVYHKEQDEEKQAQIRKKQDSVKNLHVLARADFLHTVSAEERVILRLTADDHYQLYVNGTFLGQGPAPAYPKHYYYNEFDLTDMLIPGKNVIAVHLYYQGLINRVWNSGDNRFGVAADLHICKREGIKEVPVHWKYQKSSAWSGETIGYETQFLEDFDSRLWEEEWNQIKYRDDSWEWMVPAKWADYHLSLQPAKVLSIYEKKPEQIHKTGSNHWQIDLGQEIVGNLFLKAAGDAGSKMQILCGEELTETGAVRYEMRCNCKYREIWTLKDGISSYEPYDYKGFRYVELIGEEGVELLECKVQVQHYPLDEALCTLDAGQEKIERIFKLCKNTIRYGVQEGYLDCPTREKGQYLGDALIASRAQVWLTGSTELLRKCIAQFAETTSICPGMMAVAPGSLMQEIADFSLLWPELLLQDYLFTGESAYLRQYYPAARNILIYFSKYEREDGLLEQVSEKWNLVDWPENLRDGYDFELSRPVVAAGCHNVINALYIGAMKTLSQIEHILGMPVTYDWEARKKIYQKNFFREERGLFADSERSMHCALHSNVYPLYFDLVPEGSAGHVAKYLEKKGLACGVMLSYFLLKGLARAGRYDAVYELLVNEGEHGWMNMLREGATTCFEAWGKEQKWNTSLCHPWACAPISIFIEEIAGIHLTEHTEAGYEFEPHIPKELAFELCVPFRGKSLHVRQKNDTVCFEEEIKQTVQKN